MPAGPPGQWQLVNAHSYAVLVRDVMLQPVERYNLLGLPVVRPTRGCTREGDFPGAADGDDGGADAAPWAARHGGGAAAAPDDSPLASVPPGALAGAPLELAEEAGAGGVRPAERRGSSEVDGESEARPLLMGEGAAGRPSVLRGRAMQALHRLRHPHASASDLSSSQPYGSLGGDGDADGVSSTHERGPPGLPPRAPPPAYGTGERARSSGDVAGAGSTQEALQQLPLCEADPAGPGPQPTAAPPGQQHSALTVHGTGTANGRGLGPAGPAADTTPPHHHQHAYHYLWGPALGGHRQGAAQPPPPPCMPVPEDSSEEGAAVAQYFSALFPDTFQRLVPVCNHRVGGGGGGGFLVCVLGGGGEGRYQGGGWGGSSRGVVGARGNRVTAGPAWTSAAGCSRPERRGGCAPCASNAVAHGS